MNELDQLVRQGESHFVLKRLKPENGPPRKNATKILDLDLDPDSFQKNSKKRVKMFGKFLRNIEIIQVNFDSEGKPHGEFEIR